MKNKTEILKVEQGWIKWIKYMVFMKVEILYP
jgi:hypothetical protein